MSDLVIPKSQALICENRGSGIPAVMASLRAAGMAPPKFETSVTRVQVTVPRHALLDADTLAWLASLELPDLTDGQCMALAMMRSGIEVSNETLRGWGLHRVDATNALADLVRRGLASRSGGRRYATYELATKEPVQPQLQLKDDPSLPGPGTNLANPSWLPVLKAMSIDRPVRIRDFNEPLGLTYVEALRRVNQLIGEGFVAPTAPPQSKKRAARLDPCGAES